VLAVAAVAWGAVALIDGEEKPAGADSRSPCDEDCEVIRSSRYTPEAMARASRGVFGVHKSKVKLKGDVDWNLNPEHSTSFTSNLHRFTWIDPLLVTYRADGDLDALRQATELALDWIADHPMVPKNAQSGTAWGDKITADRAPYVAFIARAAACEGITSPGETRALSRTWTWA
jgi:uncharacterized heparinase superfamily protein